MVPKIQDFSFGCFDSKVGVGYTGVTGGTPVGLYQPSSILQMKCWHPGAPAVQAFLVSSTTRAMQGLGHLGFGVGEPRI